jgi:predicted phage tail protein
MLTDVTEQNVRSNVLEMFVESPDDHFGERMASRKKGGMQLVVR